MLEQRILIPSFFAKQFKDAFTITMATHACRIVVVAGKVKNNTAVFDIAIDEAANPEMVLFQIGVLFGQLITAETAAVAPTVAEDILKAMIRKTFTEDSTPNISKN